MTDAELMEAFTEYQRGRGLSPKTMDRRKCVLRGLVRYMAPRSIATVKVADVDGWLARLRTSSTKSSYYRDLVAFYRWAQRRELIPVNPMLLTDPPRPPKHLPKPARAEVIATAVAITTSGSTQLAILLGALAGLRVSEIAALSSEDIFLDHEPPVLLVRQGKGGKDRIVPLHPTLLARLRNVEHGWLFPSSRPNSDHVAAKDIGRRVCRALTAASDGQHVTAHQLRHYFGSEAAKWAKGNIILVSGLMGHGSTNTTMGYIGWTPTDGAEVVARIGTGGRADVPDELAAARRATGSAG